MKTVAFFISPLEDLQRVQCRLMSTLTIGNWGIIVPDQPCPAECQIVETCLKLRRNVVAVGTTRRSSCGVPPRYYQRIPFPRWWQDKEWERDTMIIQMADAVECMGMPEIEERVPQYKRPEWFIPLIDPPGLGHVDFHTAMVMGLGRLLVEKLRAT